MSFRPARPLKLCRFGAKYFTLIFGLLHQCKGPPKMIVMSLKTNLILDILSKKMKLIVFTNN